MKNKKQFNENEKSEIIRNFINSNRYPLIITLGFFLIFSYITFFHHNYWWSDVDGIFYLLKGEQILSGDGHNVILIDSPVGGPIFYASVNSFFDDGFLVMKTIALLSCTGIVFVSFYIIKNIFSFKVALIGQLVVAFTPRLELNAILSMNEMLPVFLTFISLFLITKKHTNLRYLILISIILGSAVMIRYQPGLVFIGILIFVLIRDKKIRINITHASIMMGVFLIVISPLLIYNYSTNGNLIDSDPEAYFYINSEIKTTEDNKILQENITGEETQKRIYLQNIFWENYFYNLLYHNPNLFFNFNSAEHNLSIIPIIPFIGMIPVFGGLIYYLKPKWDKNNYIILFSSIIITTISVLLIGSFEKHFFAIILIPMIILIILNKKSIDNRLLPLLIVTMVFSVMISIIPLHNAKHWFPIWIIAPTLTALFIVEVIPKIYSKLINITNNKKKIIKSDKIIIVTLILLFLINVGFSSEVLKFYIYEDEYDGIKNQLIKTFSGVPLQERGIDIKEMGDFLSRQPNIENSYVMSHWWSIPYYADSKFIYTDFKEGVKGDDLNKFVTRENWNSYDRWFSNINSHPADRYDLLNLKPDYIVYEPNTTEYLEKKQLKGGNRFITLGQYNDLEILADVGNPSIPSNFELIYVSNSTGAVIYKINHSD
jgi:4-amino-4-deoxy-L-arabinose transferase-like glycosyltransferase